MSLLCDMLFFDLYIKMIELLYSYITFMLSLFLVPKVHTSIRRYEV